MCLTAMSSISTKFGPSTVLTLRKDSEQQVWVYLPRRYVSVFNDEDIVAVNKGETLRLFSFLGVTEKNAYNIVLRNK
jgi:hypothetical protein